MGRGIRRAAKRTPADCFTQALERSRADGARSFEVRAAMSLARLWKNEDGRRLLREVYDGFTEGYATADLVAARQLLQELPLA